MDITSLFGTGVAAFLIGIGVYSGQLPAFFLNWHGLGIVLGGTAAAMLLNTPFDQLRGFWDSVLIFVRGNPYPPREQIVESLVRLAEQVHSRGVVALGQADPAAVGGYLARAAAVAVEYNDPKLVEQILEMEVNTSFDRSNEATNLFRTMAVLAPMFGLLGTLIGIVSVLKDISNPDLVGRSMAVAMTTAFYGITLANLVCVPVAGKLRTRTIEELRAKGMVVDAIGMMLRGVVPLAIERKLRAYQ
jgi:chemotaxis protein MotA